MTNIVEKFNLVFADYIIKSRLQSVIDNHFFIDECAIVMSNSLITDYYKKIINEVHINRANINNSFIMWVTGKVDILDQTVTCIVQGGRYSLPDIDVDFPPEHRDSVIGYLKDKYGDNKVCQMVTFGRLAGKSILREVLRINQSCSISQINEITAQLPNESAISDQLEDSGESSVIKWTLEHKPDSLSDYCRINDDGKLEGDFSNEFKQAIRMEGVFKTQGKHAAGVVVSSEALADICPMVKSSRNSDQVAGMEMGDLEAIGCVKFDILGVSALQKCSKVIEEVNNG